MFEIFGTSREGTHGSIAITECKGNAIDIAKFIRKDYSGVSIVERKTKYPACKGAGINVIEIYPEV